MEVTNPPRFWVAVLFGVVLLSESTGTIARADISQMTIGYFLEWPSPNLAAKASGKFAEVMGIDVRWRAFNDGNEMSSALAADEIQLAYSQGLAPFVVAVSRGVPLKMISAAVSYSENNNCVVHQNADITKANAIDLEGKKIATPVGTATHYKLLRMLEHLEVDTNAVDIIQMDPSESAAALASGKVTMACAFGGTLSRMKEHGDVLMSAKEQEAIGIREFDIVSVTEDFAAENPGLIVKFLQVTEDANKAFKDNNELQLPLIAKESGLTPEASKGMLDVFSFPTRDEQLSEAWLGGAVQEFIKEIAVYYADQRKFKKILNDYQPTVDTSFLQQVQ